MLKDFKAFIARGNVLDLAVAVVMGGAFGAIVKALVDDIIMPLVGRVFSGVDFTNLFFVLKEGTKQAMAAGASVLSYGVFIQAIVNFLIIALVIFLMVRLASRFQKSPEAVTKECPFCLTAVPIASTRCAACTSELEA
jgi:large conductance mechanosensitive channel